MKRNLVKRELEVKHRMYELAILKEVSDRTGYSLNIQRILEVIAGSLNQFLEYSVVAYMLIGTNKIVFNADLECSVSPQFIKDIRGRMLKSLSAILGTEVPDSHVEETITGAVTLDVVEEPVRSYFNIPLVIGGKLAGLLTVAHTKEGLYREEEITILYKIVNQASRAVTKLEDVVRTEQSKVAAMLESMVEGVIMTDRDYRIVAANPSAKDIIGHTAEDVPTIFDFMGGLKDAFDIRAKLEEAIKLDKMVTFDDVQIRGKHYEVLVSPVKANTGMAKGQILGGAVVFHDITHEKEAEKMRNDFTSMMVHELRSPLGNIKKIGELLKSREILENKDLSTEYIGMLYESSSSMLDLVNDLLDVSKLEAGKFDLDKQETNIKDLVLDRVKFFDTFAQNAKIDLSSYFGREIPVTMLIDEKRIMQVVNNLLSNAVKFTASGGKVTVECFVHKRGASLDEEARNVQIPWFDVGEQNTSKVLPNSVVVAVTDSGEGIVPENIGKLFNKFTQFSSSVRQREHKGTGLGLVVVKGIVEAHGGTIGLGSKAGAGSTFYITLNL
jgi:PAS domain S-box-containing protein